MQLSVAEVSSILTRTCGYLTTVTSHSLQPYRGCGLGRSMCGVGCYVRHNWHINRGQQWGSFIEARTNAADAYRRQYQRERAWGRRERGRFGIFLSSSTEPFQPLEQKLRITRAVLEAMTELPPDLLILQSHSHHIADYFDVYEQLEQRCEIRFHISIETDRERLPGLPPPASSVERRLDAARRLRERGHFVVITVAPLLPIANPDRFFARLAEVADAVVIDHYIGGDGTATGSRTARTPLPQIMQAVEPQSTSLEYRDRIAGVAGRHFPGRVGINVSGYAAEFG